jgi:hypothetical protein
MADTSQGRVTPEIDDDPFAELTRIMGFDPRQPVRREEPVAAAAPEATVAPPTARHHAPVVDENDLEIDLERELMGEFSEAPDQHDAWEPQAVPAAFEPEAAEPVIEATPPTQPLVRRDAAEAATEADVAEVDVSGEDWEIDLAEDLLSGAELAAATVPVAAPPAMSDAVAVHAGRTVEPAPQRHAEPPVPAPREAFASNVELPPIPLSRHSEAAPQEDALDRDFHLALEQELGGALADTNDDEWDTTLHHDAPEDRGEPADMPIHAMPYDYQQGATAAVESAQGAGVPDGRDPYAALAALSTDLHARSHAEHQDLPDEPYAARHPAALEAPEIETVEVPEHGVPVAEELDIPEIHFEEQSPNTARYDDIDAEFANLLNEMNAMDRTSEQPARPVQPAWQPAEHDEAARSIAVPALAAAETGRRYAVDADYLANAHAAETDLADMEFAFDPDAQEDMATTPAAQRRSRGRGYLVAVAVVGVAVLGGLAAYMLPFGGSGDGEEIALVKADPSPNKVRPENPGGIEIPNQDNKVYDRVSGAGGVESPTQEKLLPSAEEPVELPMPRDEDSAEFSPFPGDVEGEATAEAAVKGEERIAQSDPDQGVDTTMEVAAVPPRKVRTMIVKADGSLVAREVPVEEASLQADADDLDPVAAETADAEEMALTDKADEVAEELAVDQPASGAAAPSATTTTTTASTPSDAPIAPTRPSDQPVDIVGEVQPTEVAALAPAAGGWSMQIASQPSEASAQASARDLQRRFPSVLDGRQLNIVKADIPNKGTFWRVRVAAGDRSEAVRLCETYKSAGGSCFVSR